MFKIAQCLIKRRGHDVFREISRFKTLRSAWNREHLEQLWMRRQILGPDLAKPRSEKPNWNYEAELFAFGCRLNEKFNMQTLRRAFLFRSHLEMDLQIRSMIAEDPSTAEISSVKHNESLVEDGRQIVQSFTKAFLRFYYPNLPEEGICAVAEFLYSDESVAGVACDIGAKDLIFSEDFPPSSKTLSDTFMAIVGALDHDSGKQRTERFVQDFLLTRLHDVDINEIFNLANPEPVLDAVLKSFGKGPAEPRLLRQAGSFTVTPIFIVGIYSNKQLLGQSPGESVATAKQMAVRESLKILWGTHNVDSRRPYNFNVDHTHLLDEYKIRTNHRLIDVLVQQQQQTTTSTTRGDSVITTIPGDDIAEEKNLLVSSSCDHQQLSLLSMMKLAPAVEREPLTPDKLLSTFKNVIEPTFGVTLRKKLKHNFYKGTPNRNVTRRFIKPKVETL